MGMGTTLHEASFPCWQVIQWWWLDSAEWLAAGTLSCTILKSATMIYSYITHVSPFCWYLFVVSVLFHPQIDIPLHNGLHKCHHLLYTTTSCWCDHPVSFGMHIYSLMKDVLHHFMCWMQSDLLFIYFIDRILQLSSCRIIWQASWKKSRCMFICSLQNGWVCDDTWQLLPSFVSLILSCSYHIFHPTNGPNLIYSVPFKANPIPLHNQQQHYIAIILYSRIKEIRYRMRRKYMVYIN